MSDPPSYADAFAPLNERPFPAGAAFINDSFAQLKFTYVNSQLGRNESVTSIVPLNGALPPLQYIHADSEKLVSYSPDGRLRALIRSVPPSPKGPTDVPKIGDPGSVNLIEIFNGDKLQVAKALKKETGNFQTHPSVSAGLRWSPDQGSLAWIAATEHKSERKSKLGCTIKMFDSKDFGEDLDGVYGTNLIVFDVAKKEARVIGAPPGHTACQFSWASGNVIILQAVDISGARPLAVRSYDNRPYHLFAVKVDAESVEFKPLLDQSKIYLWPGATQIEGGLARVFYSRFIDGFGGHAGPSHPGTFVIDLETLEVRDAKEMPDSIDIQHVTSAPFVDSGHVLITQRKRCRWFPAVIDLETFEVKELIPDELGQKSAVAEDVRGDAVILRIATPIETPRFALLKAGRLTFLTQSTTFGQYAFEVVFNDNMNDAILILAPGDTKKFIVSPHGGPCGMFSTYFSRYYAFFYLNGYSLCLVNYRGSTGYPAEVQKSLPGHCSELDADDVLFHIDRVRSLFTVSKLALWGWSHGGYVTTAVAGRYPDKIDCAVAGAPVTNFVGTYYTSDIPDWSLVESGVRIEPDAEIDIDERSLAALLKCSSVRYARDVKAPILLIHGRADRRVPLGQSLDYFYALRRHQKQVKLIIYDAPGHSMSVPETWDDTMLASVAFFEDPVGFIEHDYLAPDPPASA